MIMVDLLFIACKILIHVQYGTAMQKTDRFYQEGHDNNDYVFIIISYFANKQ